MHRALQIIDIVEKICEVTEYPYLQRRDLAVLARTCKLFFDSAISVLWRNLDRVSPLLRCMPSDLWDITESDSFLNLHVQRRSITSADWERPLVYMHRVRSFRVDILFETSDFLDALSSSLPRNRSYIFPNLEVLDWYPKHNPDNDHPSEVFHYLRLFLTPNLKTLPLSTTSVADFGIIGNLGLECPALKEFSLAVAFLIDPQTPWDTATSGVSKFVSGLTHIESLSVPDLYDAALAHVAQLPQLKRLDIRPATFTNLSAFPAANSFPVLTELYLSTMEQAIAMLTTLPECSLVEFVVGDSENQPTNQVARQFYSTLASRCSHSSLRDIHIRGNHTEPATFDMDQVSLYSVQGDILEPLFSFTNLVSVMLSHPVGFDLDDATIVAMVRAWPRIESLGFQAGSSGHIPSRVTLEGLVTFSRHCPYLYCLRLTFDASVVPETNHDAEEAQQTLRYLNVALSPIDHPQRVAKFLLAIFPKLTFIETLCDDILEEADLGFDEYDEMDVEPHVATSHDVWKKVQESLLLVHASS
ncbi:hypothetical protein MVEN_00401800 [Mycena venus]|uniref:F-box domain-containing protein n=1 Tax=Mycena venus TaxID=2733690 RepID=A0A8H6YWT8_9AGAR|nr:hypothetical protein MVEN_00401800 [Mycena venus]